MKAGYLHLGPPRSGPVRFGRMIAEFVAAYTPWDTCEVVVTPPSGGRPRWSMLRNAARRLGAADLAHVQYAPGLWGGKPWQMGTVLAFRASLRVPLITTAHDIIPGVPPSTRLAMRWLAGRSACLVVSTETERERVLALGIDAPVEVVPLYVERRGPLPEREEAKAALGLAGRRVVTLLGFIHPAKGHQLAVEALARLPDETVLVLAGGAVASGEAFLERLRADIRERGLEPRVRITGYLADDELDRWLAASDVGILPFRDLAASASLATWLTAGRPLIVSDVPVLREYAALAPGLIRVVPPGDPAALAAAIQATAPSGDATRQAAALADRFSPERTARRLAEIYARHAGTTPEATGAG